MEMFEKATRLKLRFQHKGNLSAEDLWDLPLEQLDRVYSKLSAEKKGKQEDSLLMKMTDEDRVLDLQIDIVKHIVKTKLDEREARDLRAEKKMQSDKIAAIIAKKKDAVLEDMSIEELEKLKGDL